MANKLFKVYAAGWGMSLIGITLLVVSRFLRYPAEEKLGIAAAVLIFSGVAIGCVSFITNWIKRNKK